MRYSQRVLLALGVAVCALVILVELIWLRPARQAVAFGSQYQAVLLANGQVFFGRLDGYGTSHPVMRDIYYVQTSVNPQTRESNNTLLKRGGEWHAPESMWLNPSQIVFVEPVGQNSRVAQLIADLNRK